jgi:hypothetical protein
VRLTSLKKNDIYTGETCTCPNIDCRRSFSHPLQVTVLSSNPVETYPACPYCMSKIEMTEEVQKPEKSILASIQIAAKQQKEKEENQTTSELKCSHGFGYLKNRPKGSSIPDECLTCQKMIQCLT